MANTQKKAFGNQNEELAAKYLLVRGYQIVETNWRCKQGELDIIARQGETLVFVEVRSRRDADTESAFASISPYKQKRLQRLAYTYLSQHNLHDALWRIDVIAVAVPRTGTPLIDHVENALDW